MRIAGVTEERLGFLGMYTIGGYKVYLYGLGFRVSRDLLRDLF